MINITDFKRLDIRVGTIVEVHDFPQARKPAYQLIIDFGSLGVRKSSAQVAALYAKQDLIGRQIVAVVNFPVKQIANFFSECLVLGVADSADRTVLLTPATLVDIGSEVG